MATKKKASKLPTLQKALNKNRPPKGAQDIAAEKVGRSRRKRG